MQYVIKLAYEGSQYHGWQIQNNANSVQGEINQALSKILRKNIDTIGCGRTDTGVHASCFYAQFCFDGAVQEGLVHKLNRILPSDIVVYELYTVSENFNVRFDATYRKYEYHIHQKLNPFIVGRSYYRYGALNFDAMNKAAELLLHYTDFECFSKVQTDVHTFNCNITYAKWAENQQNNWVFTIQANRFLRNMVRAVVGSLIEVGTGKIDVEGFEAIIKSKKRSEAGQSVPAQALYLVDIGYDFEANKWHKIDG
jgi:tRNA pseudouridine38-40 synthase